MIRRFRKSDAEACSKIIKLSLNRRMQADSRKRVLCETTPSALVKDMKNKQYFVCEKSKKIVGIGALSKRENEVRTMYIHPKFQGKGIGTEILNSIEKEAKKRKINKLILYTHDPAFKFYLKNGFSIIKKFINNKGETVFYMEKGIK